MVLLPAMKRVLFFCVIAVFLQTNALAGGPGTPAAVVQLKARVVESGSNEDLSGVRVSIPELNIEVYTDKNGNFELPVPVASDVLVSFSFVSYEPVLLQASAVASGVVNLQPR